MKKYNRIFTWLCISVVICITAGSCSNEDNYDSDSGQENIDNASRTARMVFTGCVNRFDQQISTKATNTDWNDGDKLYIAFYNGANIIPGEAIYNKISGWSVSYNGEFANGTNQKCEVRFFVNPTYQNTSLVSLNENSEIYEDLSGSYTFSNGSISVNAALSPKTGRIRFTGDVGEKIYISGISIFSTFSPDNNTFTISDGMISSTVLSAGSTPYIYGSVMSTTRNVSIVGSDFAFTRTFTSDILSIGESGYMAIPSDASHNNWRSGMYVNVNGIEFKMLPVSGLSSGFYLIGETEVTESLYEAVQGNNSKSTLPISNISFSSVNSFVEKLCFITHMNFGLPTQEQWEYAANGGKYSQGYIYSGSNKIEDVAWYKGNSSARQNVKLKAPNELGIYDMSGNVSESITSWDKYGGSYLSSPEQCTVKSIISSSYYDYSVGFRLILVCD